MAKISKPVGWFGFIAIVGGVAFYFLSEPDAAHKRVVHSTKGARSTAPAGFTEADMTAKFPRLSGSPLRDAFVPKIVVKKAAPVLAAPAPGIGRLAPKPTWALTGVYLYNGVRFALLENAATGESQSVKAGQSWMGQQVLSVTSRGVLLASGAQMLFAEPPEETITGATPVLLPAIPAGPSGAARPGVANAPQPSTAPQPNRPLIITPPPGVAGSQPTGSQP